MVFSISLFCFSIQDTRGDPTREMATMSLLDLGSLIRIGKEHLYSDSWWITLIPEPM